jgi:hypothetical protein
MVKMFSPLKPKRKDTSVLTRQKEALMAVDAYQHGQNPVDMFQNLRKKAKNGKYR